MEPPNTTAVTLDGAASAVPATTSRSPSARARIAPVVRRRCPGSPGFVEDLAGVVCVMRADRDVVCSRGAQPVSGAGSAVRQPGQALDAGAAQDRAEQLRLRPARSDVNGDPVVHLA